MDMTQKLHCDACDEVITEAVPQHVTVSMVGSSGTRNVRFSLKLGACAGEICWRCLLVVLASAARVE